MKVLLTGGAGFIGSHTAVALIEEGYDVVIADNYCNSSPKAIDRIGDITGKKPAGYELDVRDEAGLNDLFEREDIGCVIHFAGLKAVGESKEKPIEYYRNNLDATLALLEAMAKNHVKNIIFSSSATVYGDSNQSPLVETMERGTCSNPYGWTKMMSEQILQDASYADPELSVVLLRYFNPIGAHESGMIGEDPKGIPNNLMPFITQVAVGRRDKLTIFGNDYDTPDGTCLRDYIHVMDLAEGHVKAVSFVMKNKGVEIFNLGTGTPYSVTEIVTAFEKSTGVKVDHMYGARREGDLAELWSDATKADRILGWRTKRSIEDMCRDSWNWQSKNPEGYK